MARPNDERVLMPSNGFSLVGTLSKPAAQTTRSAGCRRLSWSAARRRPIATRSWPAFPIFGELASALADAGYVVVRYDKRGVGQSGGRAESVTLDDYADDVIAAVKFLGRRKDVDAKRIAVLGYGEGGAVAAVAAAREGKIAALVLVSSPGWPGATVVLDQQRQLLAGMKISEEEKQTKLQLQQAIQQAVISGQWPDTDPGRDAAPGGHALVPQLPSVRPGEDAEEDRAADAGRARRTRSPDRAARTPTSWANSLQARKGKAGQAVKVVKLPGMNHLLVAREDGRGGRVRPAARQEDQPRAWCRPSRRGWKRR